MPAPATRRVLRSNASAQEQETAILAAAADEFFAVGVRRASVEHIARQAGVSRSTLYRRFPSKEDILAALGAQITTEFFQYIADAVHGLNPRDTVVEAFVHTVRVFQRDPKIRRLFLDEPGTLDLIIGLQGGNVEDLVRTSADAIANTLRKAGATMPDTDLRVAAEVQFRLLLSMTMVHSQTLDINDESAIRSFAERILAPMIF